MHAMHADRQTDRQTYRHTVYPLRIMAIFFHRSPVCRSGLFTPSCQDATASSRTKGGGALRSRAWHCPGGSWVEPDFWCGDDNAIRLGSLATKIGDHIYRYIQIYADIYAAKIKQQLGCGRSANKSCGDWNQCKSISTNEDIVHLDTGMRKKTLGTHFSGLTLLCQDPWYHQRWVKLHSHFGKTRV